MPTILERMLQQAAVDPGFRSEAARFGVDRLPEPVEGQDQQFSELLNDGMEAIEVLNGCGTSCSFGPFTIVCDGGTK